MRDRSLRERRRPGCLKGSGVIGDPPRSALIGKADFPERFQRFDHALGALGSSRREPVADRSGDRAVGPLIWLLTADNEGQHAFGGVFADSESEPAAPRHADEMGAFDRQLIQDPHGVPDPHLHGICGWVVRLVAGP